MTTDPSRTRALLASLLAFAFALLATAAPRAQETVEAQRPAQAEKVATLDKVVRPFLWRIEGPVPSYLYGTIHLPDDVLTALPARVAAAIDSVDELYTELPLELGAMLKAQGKMMLPGKRRLADVVGPELHARVKAFAERKGAGAMMPMLDRFQPWAVATQLALLDRLAEIASKQPLDKVVYERAKSAKKKVGGLETIDEQIGVFSDMTDDEQRQFLAASLDSIEEDEAAGKDPLAEIVQIYLSGDEARIAALMNEVDLPEGPLRTRLIAKLLDERNLRMVDRIVRKMQEDPEKSFFFAVGAAHYPGEIGILELLRKRGYACTRLGLEPSAEEEAAARTAIDAAIARRERELEALRGRK